MFLFPPQPCAWGVDLWSLLTPSPPCAPWQRLKPDSPVSIRWRVSRRWCRSPGTRSFQMAAKIWSSQFTSWTAIQVLDWRSSCKVPGENKNFSNNVLAKLFFFSLSWGGNERGASQALFSQQMLQLQQSLDMILSASIYYQDQNNYLVHPLVPNTLTHTALIRLLFMDLNLSYQMLHLLYNCFILKNIEIMQPKH